jgi:glycosyltransferase involved in cell wall biosynthesis
MKVAIYYPRAVTGDGGASHSVRGWARALSDVGVDVVVVADAGDKAQPVDVEHRFVRHRAAAGLAVPVGLEEALNGVDLVWLHSGWVAHNLAAGLVARRMRIPYLVTPHGAYDPNLNRRRKLLKRSWWAAAESSLLRNAAATHVFFESEVPYLRAKGYGGPVVVAPNGIPVTAEPIWDGGSGGFVLWLGRCDVHHKGLDLLLEGIAMMDEPDRPHVRLHATDYRGGIEAVRRLVESLELGQFVSVRPPVYGEEKATAFRTARLFVYPSRWDSHSIAMLEALSAGLPMLVTSTTHFGLELDRAKAAIVVEPTPDALAAGIARGMRDESKRLGVTSGRLALASYGWPAVARRLVSEIERVLG